MSFNLPTTYYHSEFQYLQVSTAHKSQVCMYSTLLLLNAENKSLRHWGGL